MNIGGLGEWRGKYSPVIYVITLLMLAGCTTVSERPGSAFMPLGEAAMAPVGYLKYCIQRPDDCRSASPAAASPQSTATTVAAALPDVGSSLSARRAAPIASRRAAMPYPQSSWSDIERGPAALGGAAGLTIGSVDAMDPSDPNDRKFLAGDAWRYWTEPSSRWDEMAPVTAPTSDAAMLTASTASVEHSATPQLLPLNRALVAKLNAVNQRINYAFEAKPDVETFGDNDYWHLPLLDGTGVGDCKDFVLEKRRALIAAGVPAEVLTIAIVQTRRGEGHAVLLVATDQGEYVLDNLSPWVTSWREVDYRWLERQVAGQPLNWVSVRGFS